MRFDKFMEDVPEPTFEVLPDGDHVCEITGEKEWSSQDGSREAVIITFTPIDGHAAFDKFMDPSEERDDRVAKQLLSALGLPKDTDVGKGSLKGLRVTVTTKRAADKAGEPIVDKRTGLQRLWINGFAFAHQTAAAAEPVWRKNVETRKKSASNVSVGGSDDIPFLWLVAIVASVIGGAA